MEFLEAKAVRYHDFDCRYKSNYFISYGPIMIDPQNARKFVDQQHQNTTNSEWFYGTNQQISVYDDYHKHIDKT